MPIKTTRQFAPGDRYRYDFGPCSYAKGWAQLDTAQDASYYGNWVNPSERKTFSYCEGDTTLVECDTDEEFAAHVRESVKWHDEAGHGPARIDPGLGHDGVRAALERAGLADLFHGASAEAVS
jgi:hypothetical protein